MPVALVAAGVDAISVNLRLNTAVGGIFRIKFKRSGDILELSAYIRDHHVADAEIGTGVTALKGIGCHDWTAPLYCMGASVHQSGL